MRQALIIVSTLTLFASGAFAQGTEAERQACNPDYNRFCSGVLPGGGRIIACLKKHKPELTEACRKVVDAH